MMTAPFKSTANALRLVTDFLFGYDIFISYAWNDGTHYPVTLGQQLEKQRFRTFLDKVGYVVGTDLRQATHRRVQMSTVLLVVLRPEAVRSAWVLREVEESIAAGKAVITVNINQTFENTDDTAPLKKLLINSLRINEVSPCLDGEPASATLAEITRRFKFTRRESLLFRTVVGAAIVFALIAAVAVVLFLRARDSASRERIAAQSERSARKGEETARKEAEKQRDYAQNQEAIAKQQRNLAQERLQLAQSQALASDARREMIQELNTALLRSAAAYKISPSIDAQTALLESLTRAEKIRRYFPCRQGQKATGVTFSNDVEASVAFACSSSNTTTASVVDERGTFRRTARVKGDGRSLSFADRNTLAIGGSKDLRVLDIESGAVSLYSGHSASISALASRPSDGQLFSGDGTGEVRAWLRAADDDDRWTSRVLRKATSRAATRLIYQKDNNSLQIEEYGQAGAMIKLQEGAGFASSQPQTTTEPLDADCLKQHPPGTRYRSTANSTDGQTFAYTTEANEIVVADRRTGQCRSVLFGHTHNILDMAYSQDGIGIASAGAIADADDKHGVILWDLAQIHPLAKLLRPIDTRASFDAELSLSNDGSSWACAKCGGTLVWDGKEVSLPNQFSPSEITSIAISREGRELALGFSDGHVLRAARLDGRLRFAEGRSSPHIQRLWYAGSDLYSVSLDASVSHWLGGQPRTVARLGPAHSDTGCRDIYSAGAYLAIETRDSSNASILAVHDLANGTNRAIHLPPDAGNCSSLAYVGDLGIAIRLPLGYEPIYVVSLGTTPELRPWDNPVRAVPSGLRTSLSLARISDDGKRLITTSNGNSLVLFDLPSQRLIGVLDVPDIHAIAMSGDGKHVLTFNEYGILIWDIDPDNWARRAVEMAGHSR
jgi:WD40 repeat protein